MNRIPGLDDWIMGVNDPHAPFNREDEEEKDWEYQSDCCGAIPLMADFDTGLCMCSDCKEHAGIVGIDKDGEVHNMWE